MGDELELIRSQELTQISFEAEQAGLKAFNDAKQVFNGKSLRLLEGNSTFMKKIDIFNSIITFDATSFW